MESSTDFNCQWDHCEVLPAKHAHLGFRHLESVDGPCGRAVITTVDHYDLCDTHLANVHEQYDDVIEYEVGDCPECNAGTQPV